MFAVPALFRRCDEAFYRTRLEHKLACKVGPAVVKFTVQSYIWVYKGEMKGQGGKMMLLLPKTVIYLAFLLGLCRTRLIIIFRSAHVWTA